MSNGRPTLFISHSSTEDDLARRVIKQLREPVCGTLDLLLDEEVLEDNDGVTSSGTDGRSAMPRSWLLQ